MGNNFQHKEKLTEQLIKAWGMNNFYWCEIMLWCTPFYLIIYPTDDFNYLANNVTNYKRNLIPKTKVTLL